MAFIRKVLEYIPALSKSQPDLEQATTSPRKVYFCGPISGYNWLTDYTKRIDFMDNSIRILGWSSRGGVIIHENISPADFDFLCLDRRSPPMLRHDTPEEEDIFCKKLLLLGARWWDSKVRYWVMVHQDTDMHEFDESGVPGGTLRERHWVSVAWPSTGGVVISSYKSNMYSGSHADDDIPEDIAILQLCTNMDEKAEVLRERFEGKDLDDVKNYHGDTFLNCWEWKVTGEIRELEQTWPED